jgi:hypothetical protein
MRTNYFERAAAYERTAEEFDARGLTASAKRAREKAAFYEACGVRHMHMWEVWWILLLRRERFLRRVTRKHRWRCRTWGARCWHSRRSP